MEDGKTPTFRKFLNPNFEVHPEGDYWEKIKPLKAKTALLIIDVQKHDQDLAVELRNAGNSYRSQRLEISEQTVETVRPPRPDRAGTIPC
jgi:hypothetical protein